MNDISAILILVSVAHFYFLPTITAFKKKIDWRSRILVANIFMIGLGPGAFFAWGIAFYFVATAESKRQYQFQSEDTNNLLKSSNSKQENASVLTDLVIKKEHEVEAIHNKIEKLKINANLLGQLCISLILAPIVGRLAFHLLLGIASKTTSATVSVLIAIEVFMFPINYRFVYKPEQINKFQQELLFLSRIITDYYQMYVNEVRTSYLPKIHMLGLASIQDVQVKIKEPKIVGTPSMLQYLLDYEADRNMLDRIKMKDGTLIYKSTLNKRTSSNFERIELSID